MSNTTRSRRERIVAGLKRIVGIGIVDRASDLDLIRVRSWREDAASVGSKVTGTAWHYFR